MTTSLAETPLVDIDVGGDRYDALFDVLSDARRRFVLAALLTADRPVSLSELTTDVVGWETELSSPTAAATERERVEISLVHRHLPKLSQAGLVSYDDEAETLRLGDCADDVRTHLAPVASD